MIETFDFYNQLEIPYFILCNPDKTEIDTITLATDKKLSLRYNSLSEFTFEIPNKIDTETLVSCYSLIKGKRLILIESIGYFRITDVQEKDDGIKKVKNVTCHLLESELIQKKLTAFGGTMKLYDALSPETTLLGLILQRIPTWSIGTVDASLLNTFRTFDISNASIYSFLMDDVENAYGCIFTFDSFSKTISATSRENAIYESDIYLSYDNLILNLDMKEITEEITTALYVYGSGNLDIRTVNPLGTSVIYNFDYYKSTDWMSQGLIDAINLWETLVSTYQSTYADTLTLLKTNNFNKNVMLQELNDLETEFLVLEGVQKVRIEARQTYADITAEMNAKQLEIDAKNAEIVSVTLTIESLTLQLQTINSLLSFDNNFTDAQYLELSNFIIENTYQNENFVQTTLMTFDEIQDTAQSLYDQAQEVLVKLSSPRYEFSIDSVNYVFLEDYKDTFTSQTRLGSIVRIERDEDEVIETYLLEININYDDPSDFSMIFSNRLRLDNEGYIYSDLFGQNVKTSTSVSFDKLNWSDWENNYQGDVTDFITSSLNTANNKLINSNNQEITITQNGLKGRQFLPDTETYSPKQVWLTSSILAFTDDAWNTAKAALGEIDFGGTSYYGLVAEAIVGNIIAGNQLTISNEGGTFVVDSAGATLTNATFTINSLDNKSRIFLNPSDGIKVQGNVSGTWVNKFYVDSSGNVIFTGALSGATGSFTGAITAASGVIGGWTISSVGLSDTNGNFIRSNGNVKLGPLSITGSTATFAGTIQADKLTGEVQWSQIVNAPLPTSKFNGGSGYSAGGITTGSMLGNRINGGTISNARYSLPGVIEIYANGNQAVLDSSISSIRLLGSGSASVTVGSGNISMSGSTEIFGTLYLTSLATLQTPSGNGLSTSVTVSVPGGTRTLRFSKGILYSTT